VTQSGICGVCVVWMLLGSVGISVFSVRSIGAVKGLRVCGSG